jgi:hypothetical protein
VILMKANYHHLISMIKAGETRRLDVVGTMLNNFKQSEVAPGRAGQEYH